MHIDSNADLQSNKSWIYVLVFQVCDTVQHIYVFICSFWSIWFLISSYTVCAMHGVYDITCLPCLWLGHTPCLHVQQKEMQVWGLLNLPVHMRIPPQVFLQEHGMYVLLVISYVLKWMEMKTMLCLAGECIYCISLQYRIEELCLSSVRNGTL